MSYLGRSIALIGFMAVGKTTIAADLARSIQAIHIDTDSEIEKQEEMSISSILEKKSEDYFRHLESKIIKNLPLYGAVISLGGGTPCYHDNILFLRSNFQTISIDVDTEEVYRRISKDTSRPLGASKTIDELKKMKLSREIYYQMAAYHFRVQSGIVEEIISALKL